MTSQATPAAGTYLQVGDGADPENFTTIAEVTKITGPNSAVQKLEATSHSSSGGWREYKPGWIDPGELTFDLHYLPLNATQENVGNGLRALMTSKKIADWRLVYPVSGSPYDAFSGYVSKFAPTADFNALLDASVAIQLTGQPTQLT